MGNDKEVQKNRQKGRASEGKVGGPLDQERMSREIYIGGILNGSSKQSSSHPR
jgi:hypothetical protein